MMPNLVGKPGNPDYLNDLENIAKQVKVGI